MERQCNFVEVIAVHLRKSQFLTFQKFRQTPLLLVVDEDGICLFDQLIYQHRKTRNGQGILINGQREGLWIIWYSGDRIWARGQFHEGEREGLWTSWCPNGDISSKGVFHGGEKKGLWIYCLMGVMEEYYP